MKEQTDVGHVLSTNQVDVLSRCGGDPDRHRVRMAVDLVGLVPPGDLAERFSAVIERHEILRTKIAQHRHLHVPVQVIGDEPQVRMTIEGLSAERTRIHLDAPAVIADRATLDIIVREMFGVREGTVDDPIQYADAAVWLNDIRAAHAPERARLHWERVGDALDPAASLAMLRGEIDGQQARTASVEIGTRDADVVLGALAVVLERLTGSPSLLIAELVDGRTHADLTGACGPYERAVPVRVDVDGRCTVSALVDRVRSSRLECAAAAEHVRWPEGVAGFDACGVSFDVVDPLFPIASGGGVGRRVRAHVDGRAPLHVSLDRSTTPPVVHVDASATHTDVEAASIAAAVATVAAEMSVAPGAVLEHLPLTVSSAGGPAEDERAAAEHDSLHRRISEQAARTPNAAAVACGDDSIDFATLDERSDRLASELMDLGVRRGDLVGILLPVSIDLIVALVAVWKAGGAYLPLDRDAPLARLNVLVNDAEPRLVLVDDTDLWAGVHAPVWSIDDLLGALDTVRSRGRVEVEASSRDLAYAIFTSGSTGRPKAVMIEHGSVLALHEAMRFATAGCVDGATVVGLNAAITFDASVQQIVHLLDGNCLHLYTERERRDDRLLIDAVHRSGATVLNATPTHLRVLLDAGLLERCPDLSLLLIAGEELDPSLWDRIAVAEHVTAFNIYGPTEATVNATATSIRAGQTPTIGSALAGYSVRVLDRDLREVPTGFPGELCIGGVGVGRGYLGRPALTAAAFTPDPFGPPGARLYRTGDRALVRPTGDVRFLGRIDHQVKIRGIRVDPGEVEAALLAVPGVASGAVRANVAADGLVELVAYIVAAGPANLDLEEVRAALEHTLPTAFVPARLVVLDALPRTTSGKIDRRELDRVGATDSASSPVDLSGATDLEMELVRLWQATLGRDDIGIDDSFFTLGGDSIRSIRLRAAAAEAGLDFSIQELFDRPTIRELAKVVVRGAVHRSPSPPPFGLAPTAVRRPGVVDAYPMTSTAASMLYQEARDPDRPMFRNVRSVLLRGPFAADALRASVGELAACHPQLRSTVDFTSAPEPLMIVHDDLVPPVVVHDWRGRSDVPSKAAAIATDRSVRFAVQEEPLLRFAAFRLEDELTRLNLTMHEAGLDGWSAASLLSELLERYSAHLEGRTLPLAIPPASVADAVAKEIEARSDPGERAFWADEVGSGVGIIHGPWRFGDPDDPTRCYRVLEVPIEPSVSKGVHDLAAALGVPVRSVVLAVHLRVVAAMAGRSDVRTAVVANLRPETTGGDRAIGQFLNSLVFAFDVRATSWRALTVAVHAHERRLAPHRRYPVAATEAAWGGSLFDTEFNFTHFHIYGDVAQGPIEVLDQEFHELTDLSLLVDFNVDALDGNLSLTLSVAESTAEEGEVLCRMYRSALMHLVADPEASPVECFADPPTRGVRVADVTDDLESRFAAQVSAHPDRIAVEDGNAQVSYRRLDAWTDVVAQELLARGAGPEVPVTLVGRRGVSVVVAALAILRAGAVVVTGRATSAGVLGAGLVLDADVMTIDGLPTPGAATHRHSVPRHDPDSLAYIHTTSGTTGRPRLVGVSRRALQRHLDAKVALLDLGVDDRVAQTAELDFDIAIWQMLAPLLVGATTVVVGGDESTNADRVLAALAARSITVAQLVPSMIGAALASEDVELPALRWMSSTGDVLPPATTARWLERFPSATLVNAYGPAECADQIAHHVVGQVHEAALRVPIGTPIQGADLLVLDGDLVAVPAGCPGELFVGGEVVGRGYVGEPAATAARFRPDPRGHGRLFATGDTARVRPDGGIELLGRRDSMLKIDGVRIELEEIECVLASHPGVRDVAVSTRRLGERVQIAAHLVAQRTEIPLVADLARRQLPVGAVPSVYAVIDAVPRTSNGKVARERLPWPAHDREVGPQPATAEHRLVSAIWSDVVGSSPEGIDEHFREAGGGSVAAMMLAWRLELRTGAVVPVSDILNTGTVRTIAAAAAAHPAYRPASVLE